MRGVRLGVTGRPPYRALADGRTPRGEESRVARCRPHLDLAAIAWNLRRFAA